MEAGGAEVAFWRSWSLPQILKNRKEGRMAGMQFFLPGEERSECAAEVKGVCGRVPECPGRRGGW